MSRSTFKTLILASVTAVALAGVAHAGIVGESTDETHLKVGASVINAGPHTAGKAGVAVASMSTPCVSCSSSPAALCSTPCHA